jgi:hypothetical protein
VILYFMGGEFSTGTLGNFQPVLTMDVKSYNRATRLPPNPASQFTGPRPGQGVCSAWNVWELRPSKATSVNRFSPQGSLTARKARP